MNGVGQEDPASFGWQPGVMDPKPLNLQMKFPSVFSGDVCINTLITKPYTLIPSHLIRLSGLISTLVPAFQTGVSLCLFQPTFSGFKRTFMMQIMAEGLFYVGCILSIHDPYMLTVLRHVPPKWLKVRIL